MHVAQSSSVTGVAPTRQSPDGPEVSTQAENPVALTHSSQTVTAWCSGRVISLDRDGASWTKTSPPTKDSANDEDLHLYVLPAGIWKVSFP